MLLDSRTLPATWGVRFSLFSLCLFACVLHAQTPEQRRTIDAFRDSLSASTDSLRLRDREEQLLRAAVRARNDALLHLRLGELALRQGELGGFSHYEDAASEFNWAAELSPQWPYAWFGLGLAEFSLGSGMEQPAGAGGKARSRAWSRAAFAFRRAVLLEPALARRLEELAGSALRSRAPEGSRVFQEGLQQARGQGAGGRGQGRLLLALGRVQRMRGDSAALQTFEAYLASNDDRPLALLELGRSELLAGYSRGMATYLAGAAAEDPQAVAEYREDLLAIADDAELAAFELSRGAARAEMLRRFWARRDRLELRRDGERLAEQLRRMRVAQREFLVVSPEGGRGEARLDDRGRVYLRHGEPDERARFTLRGMEPNESWRYQRGDSEVVLHFVARQLPTDFRLVESVLDLEAGLGEDPTAPAPKHEQLLRSRSALAPVYGQARSAGRALRSRYLSQERSQGRRAIQFGTGSDSYPLRFARELPAWHSILVAGGTGLEPALQLCFAIPGYALTPERDAAGAVYPVRVRFVALDADGKVVAAIDSLLRILVNDPVPANRSLLGRLALPAPPGGGRFQAHLVLQYGEQTGANFGVDTIVVPALGSQALGLGDLVLGEPASRLKVPSGSGVEGGEVALSPGGQVHRADGAELGTEVFGLPPLARARLRVLIARFDPAEADAGAALHWKALPDWRGDAKVTRANGAGPIVPWRTALPLQKLKAGSWLLAVEVRDESGRTARRETRLVVALP